MATAPCPRCGGLAPLGAGFCPFCGSSLNAPLAGSPPTLPPAPGQYVATGTIPFGYSPAPVLPAPFVAPGYATPGTSSPSPATREADHQSLGYILAAAVVWLCTGVVSTVLLSGRTTLITINMHTSPATYTFSTLFYVTVVVSAGLSLLEVLLLRAAFHRLAPVDPRFSGPSRLALLLIIGFVIVLVGLVPLLQGAQSILGCTANSNGTLSGNCSGIGEVLAGALLVLAGAIVALIGYIGCLIGIWRFGARFQNDLFKFGAILLIFPLLNVLGAILLLVAAYTARSRLGTPAGVGFSQP